MAQTVEEYEDFQWISEAKRQLEQEITRDIKSRDTKGYEAFVNFDEVMRLNMGSFMPPMAWVEQHKRSRLLLKQTEKMAEALQRQGIAAKRESNIVRVDDVTGEVTHLPAFRNICFLPAVAKRNRREQMLDLEYYLTKIDKEQGKHWRYVVITFGERIPAFGDLKEARRAAVKQIARWRERVLKKLGAKVGFVGWEFPRDEDGTYHLHANVLLWTPYFFDKGAAFRAQTTSHFGTWWKDNGRIEKVEELVKYPFKPNSVNGASDDELAWLYRETFGERITNILGPIQEWRKWRNDSSLRVFRLKQNLRLRSKVKIAIEDNGWTEDDIGQEREEQDTASKGENVIVGREAPSFRSGLWATSGTLVWNYNPQPDERAMRSRIRLTAMSNYQADARADYERSGAPDPRVAAKIRDAALAGEGGRTNLRALWRDAHDYMVHNDTISSHDEDGVVIEEFDEVPDPPPGNIIQLR